MLRLQGIGVSPGIAIGEAFILGREDFRIPRHFVTRDAVENELERFQQALEGAAAEIARNRDIVTEQLGDKYGAIFEVHLQMLQDPKLVNDIHEMIRQRHYSPEYAVSRVMRRYYEVFRKLPNQNFAERAHDITDLEKRLLRQLLGRPHEEIRQINSPVLVVAHNLTPSETAGLDQQFVRGFVTEVGGPSSHTAIVAQGMGIPAVVGTGPFLNEVSGGDLVIADGTSGEVIVSPDEATRKQFEAQWATESRITAELESLRELPAVTRDGVQIHLYGNIEFPHEAAVCFEHGAEGIGLYRTEFLYLGKNDLPDEDEHYQAYCDVIRTAGDKPVVIRTFDMGADKVPEFQLTDEERNPFLGLRSIRLALRFETLLRTQLRAILRASVHGNVRIMFPLISTVMELRQAKMILHDVMEDMTEQGIPFRRDVPVGMMVEVPSTAITLHHFLDDVDFVSIGTNDLIQYTLAVDRGNTDVVGLYNPSDPAVLSLIASVLDTAGRRAVSVSMCGQMCSSPVYTMLLLGMGLRDFSLVFHAMPEIKLVCRSVTIDQCRQVAEQAMRMENARNIKAFLRQELKNAVPDLANYP